MKMKERRTEENPRSPPTKLLVNHNHFIDSSSLPSRSKEDELRMSGDPRYSHLLEDLHVEISTFAAPAEAHARIAYALAEVRRFLVPVSEHKAICLNILSLDGGALVTETSSSDSGKFSLCQSELRENHLQRRLSLISNLENFPRPPL